MRNLITVLLLICSVLMTVCGVILYQDITGSPAAEPQQNTAPAPEVSPEDGGAQILVPGQAQDGDDAQIVDDSGLPSPADFRMVDREGNTVRLSDFFGKPILMNFWATWCPPCQSELPYFNEAYAQYGDQIQFMMVDLADGVSETQEGCISFAEEKGYHFPLFFDTFSEGFTAYGISAIPLTVAVNANGKIVASHLGAMNESQLQDIINLLIKP